MKGECGIVLSDTEGGKGGGRVRLEGCKGGECRKRETLIRRGGRGERRKRSAL